MVTKRWAHAAIAEVDSWLARTHPHAPSIADRGAWSNLPPGVARAYKMALVQNAPWPHQTVAVKARTGAAECVVQLLSLTPRCATFVRQSALGSHFYGRVILVPRRVWSARLRHAARLYARYGRKLCAMHGKSWPLVSKPRKPHVRLGPPEPFEFEPSNPEW